VFDILLICLQGDHMQVSNSEEEDEEEAEDEFHYEMELGDQRQDCITTSNM